MKKIIPFLIIASTMLTTGFSQKPKDYVILGQLFNTFGHGSREVVKGKVKEFKQTHFWAEEKDGKIVKGRIITLEDRKKNPLGRDYTEEFNESGIVTKSSTYDENGKVLMEINANSEGKELKNSEYHANDRMVYKVSYLYKDGKMIEAIARDPKNDSLVMSIKYEYDIAGNITKTQNFNSKNEPQGYNTSECDENGYPVNTRSYNKDGRLTSLHDYVYNKKGERTGHHEENFINGDILDFTFRYEYDKMGNYTAIVFMKNGKPFIYRAREITYYN